MQKHGVDLVSGGTDNHLMLLDLRSLNITGKDAEKVLDAVAITVNKNTIPDDPQSPFVTSGIRVGTPAVTSRGMKEAEMEEIAEIMAMVPVSYTHLDVYKRQIQYCVSRRVLWGRNKGNTVS